MVWPTLRLRTAKELNRTAVHLTVYGTRLLLTPVVLDSWFSRRRRSVCCTCRPLIPNSLMELATHLQWHIQTVHGARACRREQIRMPRAKFGPDSLKTVAVHKEQRNRQTDTDSVIYNYRKIWKFQILLWNFVLFEWSMSVICDSILCFSWHGSWRTWFPTCQLTSICWCNASCTWRRKLATMRLSRHCTRNEARRGHWLRLLRMQWQWDATARMLLLHLMVPTMLLKEEVMLLPEKLAWSRGIFSTFWCCEPLLLLFFYPNFFYTKISHSLRLASKYIVFRNGKEPNLW